MPNEERLREVVDVIRAYRHRWDQTDWASGTTNPDTLDWRECNTTFCFAGWAAALAGYRPRHCMVDGQPIPTAIFYHPDTGAEGEAPLIGRELLELDDSETGALFHYMTDSVDDIADRVEEIIAGQWQAIECRRCGHDFSQGDMSVHDATVCDWCYDREQEDLWEQENIVDV